MSTKVVPVCFPESLFFKQMVLLVTSSSFPVSPLGLIHVKQVIRAFEPLVQILEEPVDLRTEVSRLEMVPKGIEIDFTCRVFLRGRDICIWEGVTTLLSRNAGTVKRQTRARPTKPPAPSCAARDTGVQCWIPSAAVGQSQSHISSFRPLAGVVNLAQNTIVNYSIIILLIRSFSTNCASGHSEHSCVPSAEILLTTKLRLPINAIANSSSALHAVVGLLYMFILDFISLYFAIMRTALYHMILNVFLLNKLL